RDDLAAGASAVFTPPVSTFADQFSNISITEKDGEVLTTQWEDSATLAAQQWPGLGQDGDGGGASAGQGRRRRTDDRERRARESPKELTWEERIRKGAVQKERVEQRGLERPERIERDGRDNISGNGRHKGQRGGRYGAPARSERSGREPILSPVLGERDGNPCRNGQTMRIAGARGNRAGDRPSHYDTGPRMVPLRPPQYYSHGVPLLMARGAYYRTGPPPVVCVPQQDQRFRNTWLDANLGINYPSVQMVDYAFTPCCGGYRPRPISSGRSGYRYPSKNPYKEATKAHSNEQASCEADHNEKAHAAAEHDESLKADEEETWESENEEEKQNRWTNNMYWPYDKEKPEKENPSTEENHTTDENEQSKDSDITSSDCLIIAADLSMSYIPCVLSCKSVGISLDYTYGCAVMSMVITGPPTIRAQSIIPREERLNSREDVVHCGQLLSFGTDVMSGHGTIPIGDKLSASVSGVKVQYSRLFSCGAVQIEVRFVFFIICFSYILFILRYVPKIGDVVVGRIASIQRARWKVDVNYRMAAILHLNNVNLPGGELRRKGLEDEVAMSKHLVVGDMVSAEVQQIRMRGQLQLHTRNLKYGKLGQGVMVKVPPSLVKPQKEYMHEIYGVGVIIGCNGIIWISPALNTDPDGGYNTDFTSVKELAHPEISSVLVPRITDMIKAEEKRRALEKDREEAARKRRAL
ncbi:hypothetical protein OSTOST_01840, partial [Ostertagia ostertagi]